MKKFALTLIATICAVFAMNADDLYIVGQMTGWETGKAQQMTENPTGVYTWTGKISANDDFKFLTSRNWAPCWIPNMDGKGTNLQDVTSGETYDVIYREKNEGPDRKFKMTESGNYIVTVDLNNKTMTAKLNADVVVFPDLYIVGQGTPAGWSMTPGNKWRMAVNNDTHTYTKTIYLTADARFVFLAQSGAWWPRFLSDTAGDAKFDGAEPGQQYTIKKFTGGMDSAGFGLKQAGVYKITIHLNDDAETGTMSLEYAPLSIVGPVTVGWNLGPAPAMDILEDGNYTYTGDLLAGEFRINAKGDWWPSFVMENASNGNTPIAADGGSYNLAWSAGEPPSMNLAEDGNYTFNLSVNGDAPVLTVIRNGNSEEQPLTELYIVGNALNGIAGAWSLNDQYRKAMDAGENPGEFIYCQHFYPGQFKFLEKYGDWNPGLGATVANQEVADGGSYPLTSTANGDHKFVIPEEGTYTITAYTFGDDKHITVANGGIPTGVENVADNAAAFSINGRTITGTAEIYDTMGRKIGAIADGSITLPAAGIYVAVSGNKAIKIAVK